MIYNIKSKARELLSALEHITQYLNYLHPLTEYNLFQKDGKLKLSLFEIKNDEINSDNLFSDITCFPPEYLEKNEYNSKSLAWFFGIILYMLQFKENPFNVGTQTEVRNAILHKELVFPEQCNKNLIVLIKKLLAKKPERPNFDLIKNDGYFN